MSNLSTEHVRVAVRDEGLTLLYQPAEGKPVVKYESRDFISIPQLLISFGIASYSFTV